MRSGRPSPSRREKEKERRSEADQMDDLRAGADSGAFPPGASPKFCADEATRAVQRDLLPLPRFPVCRPAVRANATGCRAVRQRAARQLHVESDVDRCVKALNGMFTHCPAPTSAGGRAEFTSLGQRLALKRVRDSVVACGAPPCDLSPAEALKQLRVASWYGVEGTSLDRFSLPRVSLPDEGCQPIALAELWGDGGHVVVDDFCRRCVGPPEPAEGDRRPALPKQPYSDPALRSAKEYGKFLRHLAARNLIDFALPGQRQASVGLFFVKKEGGKMRMVIDCRLSNESFCRPDSVSL